MFIKEKKEDFPYDVTMFWEFFRWERLKLGHIYLQCFPNGKLYAGQTINFRDRMKSYHKFDGSNPHHTNALKLHGWSNVNVLSIECPWYMLDTVEIFLISYYNLVDSKKGYNKQSGGRKHWHHSKETRAKMSVGIKLAWKNNPERLDKLIEHNKRINTPERVSAFVERTIKRCTGVPLTEEHKQKTGIGSRLAWKNNSERLEDQAHRASQQFSGVKRPEQSKRQKGAGNHRYGKKNTKENNEKHSIQMSGSKNPAALPVCAFGIVYSCGKDASIALMEKLNQKSTKFITGWISRGINATNVFKITNEFYLVSMLFDLKNVTKEFYDHWLALDW
jgi:hypothetical protein